MKLKATIVAGALWAALASAGHATTLPYKNFDALVQESEGIVMGTVRKVETAPGARSGDLYTFVTIDQLEVISGRVADRSLVLRLRGGFDGRQGLHVEGAPQFSPEERVLLFVQGNGRDLVPFVGWSQGVFKLVPDASGALTVRDAEGNAIVGLQGADVQRQAGQALETKLVGVPGAVRARSAPPQASAGVTESGAAVGDLQVRAAELPAMTADSFLAQVRSRAAAAPKSADRTLQSANALDLQRLQPESRDTAATVAPAADQPVARPANGAAELPLPRKAAPARDQR